MYFSKIRVQNFRNLNSLDLDLNSGVNIFVGENGQGKTNFIESIYYLIRGRSFRPTQSESLRPNGKVECTTIIQGRMNKGNLTSLVESKFSSEQKKIFLNSKAVRQSQLFQMFPIVLFSPESLSVIKSGPEARRELIDEIVVSHGQAATLEHFKKALKTRNKVLNDVRLGSITEMSANQLLEALNPIYIEASLQLTTARIHHLNCMKPYLRLSSQAISPRDLGDISVDYLISKTPSQELSKEQIRENICNRLKLLGKNEFKIGKSLVGPHKHELNFLSYGNDARYFCSQGQQRALILAFKMAQIMYHDSTFRDHPILLLDDVLSELDPNKGANLLKFLEEIRSQIFLTTTDISFPFEFQKYGMSIFRMNQGSVERLEL